MIIIYLFCFGSSFAAQFLLFDIRMTQEISEGEVGNGNCNIHFKNNFNRLIMNTTKQILFTDKMCIYDAYN